MEAFKLFDKDGSGEIDAEELKEAMMRLGDQLTQEEAEDMIKSADIDKDGKINIIGEHYLTKKEADPATLKWGGVGWVDAEICSSTKYHISWIDQNQLQSIIHPGN